MSDLRKSLQKQREMEREFQEYGAERDRLAAQERKDIRAKRSQKDLFKSIGKAADALGKIGASEAGGLVTGDLVPDLQLGDMGESGIRDSYDTQRVQLSEKAQKIRNKITDLVDERRIEEDERVAARRAETEARRKKREADAKKKEEERKKKAEEKAIKKAKTADEKEVFKANKAARKEADKAIKPKLLDDVRDDVVDGDEVVEILEEKGVPEEIIAPFRETLGFMEDEELQVKTLTELKEKLRVHYIKKRVREDMEDGKTFSPAVLEALGITDEPEKPLTSAPTSGTVKESATESGATGEPKKQKGGADGNPNTYIYEIRYPDGSVTPTPEITTERAEEIREKNPDIQMKRIPQK